MLKTTRVMTITRICCILIMTYLLFQNRSNSDIFNFLVMSVLSIWIIPRITVWIFAKESYDGTFLIDETDPTDVKMRLVMDTPMEDVAKMDYIQIKIDIMESREDNMPYDEGGEQYVQKAQTEERNRSKSDETQNGKH